MYKCSRIAILFVFLFLVTACISSHQLYSSATDTGLTERPLGFATEEAVTERRIIIDDFEGGDQLNRLGLASGAWNSDPYDEFTSCVAEVIAMPAPDRSQHVLRLNYDIDAPISAQNGYWTKLGNLDAAGYDYLEFLVKGDPEEDFTTTFKIEIKKFKDRQTGEKLTGSYIVSGVNSSWQRISIPLSKFNAIREWTDLDEMVIIFHDRLCDKKTGTLYFDGFRFVKALEARPSAFDHRPPMIQKVDREFTPKEWSVWLASRLKGYPKTVYVEKKFSEDDDAMLREIARDTWRFFDQIVDKETHLPLDTICLSEDGVFGKGAYVGDYTNVTNIGLYLMAIVSAYDFDFIDSNEAIQRISDTLMTVESSETYNHFLYNYYDTTTAERTSNFISLIDSGWLASGIYVVKNAFPEHEELVNRCEVLLSKMDFSFFYDPIVRQFYHGYYENIDVFANYHYGAFYTEPRIVSYLAVAKGDVPLEHWFLLDRTLPENYTWQQQTPQNRVLKKFREIDYFGGYYEYKDKEFVPSWGGSLFEALMPTILLKEKELSPRSLGLNGIVHAEIQAAYALNELEYPVWGMSPCSVPGDGYSEFGVDILGMKGYKNGVVTPHVTFLALDFTPDAAIKNIRALHENYNIYGEYGFYDAVDPVSREVALKYLCLDQAMIFISLNNYLNDNAIRNRFHRDPVIRSGEYLLSEENLFE
jgi:hypothetical protein